MKSRKDELFSPKHSSYRTSALGRITRGSHITPLCSLLHTPLKDKCMCLQDEWNCKSHILQDKGNIGIFLSPELPRFQKAATRMHYSSTYPVYGQPGGFSKCPFYHSISRRHHIYKVSLLYVLSHVSVATKVSESFSHRNGNSTVEISVLCRHFLEVIYL